MIQKKKKYKSSTTRQKKWQKKSKYKYSSEISSGYTHTHTHTHVPTISTCVCMCAWYLVSVVLVLFIGSTCSYYTYLYVYTIQVCVCSILYMLATILYDYAIQNYMSLRNKRSCDPHLPCTAESPESVYRLQNFTSPIIKSANTTTTTRVYRLLNTLEWPSNSCIKYRVCARRCTHDLSNCFYLFLRYFDTKTLRENRSTKKPDKQK